MLLWWSIVAAAFGIAVGQPAQKNPKGPVDPDQLPDLTGAKLYNWFITNPNLFQQIYPDDLEKMKDYVYGKRLKFAGKPHAFNVDLTLPSFKQMITYLANKDLNPEDAGDKRLLKKKEEEVKKKLMNYLAMAFITSNNLPKEAHKEPALADGMPIAQWPDAPNNATAPPNNATAPANNGTAPSQP